MKAAHRRLVFRFAMIALAFPFVAWMLARAWQPGTLPVETILHLQAFTGLEGGAGLETLAMTGLGLYFALLVLLTLDVRKRTQGVLLLVGSLLAIGVLHVQDLLVPNIDATSWANWIGFGIGIAAALALEASTIVDFDRKNQHDPPPREFQRTRHALFALSLVLVLGGLSYHVHVTEPIGLVALDALASLVLVALVAEFLSFDASHTVMVLGPKGAGKSMFLIGMFLQLQQRYEEHPLATAPQPTEDLRQLLLDEDRLTNGEGWPPDSNKRGQRGIKEVGFEFVAGTVFPTRVRFAATDHAGEHLDDIAAYIANGHADASNVAKASFTSDDEDEEDGGPASFASNPHAVGEELASQVEEADNLFLLIDSEKLLNGDAGALGLEHFDAIARETDAEITLIATKSDLLLEEYANGDAWIRSLEEDLVPDEPEEFDRFEAFSTERLRASGVMVDTLMRDAKTGNVLPVYFKTRRTNGSFKPDRDEGTLVPVGFGKVYETIEETLAA